MSDPATRTIGVPSRDGKISACVFVTGATGFIGSKLCARLVARGAEVRALVRPASLARAPEGARCVAADPLEAASYLDAARGASVLVHLVGAHSPAPWRARQFREIDERSAFAAIEVAERAAIGQFVYLSVAQPAPIMRSYLAVRARCEARLRERGLSATIVRPWYVLGPGRRWPLALAPLYAVCARLPATREGALRLGLVTLEQLLAALEWSIATPVDGVRVLDVPRIRELGSHLQRETGSIQRQGRDA